MPQSFKNQDLRGRTFRGRQDLVGADFSGCDLRGADFRNANLTRANFFHARFGKTLYRTIFFNLSGLVMGLNLGVFSGVFSFFQFELFEKASSRLFSENDKVFFIFLTSAYVIGLVISVLYSLKRHANVKFLIMIIGFNLSVGALAGSSEGAYLAALAGVLALASPLVLSLVLADLITGAGSIASVLFGEPHHAWRQPTPHYNRRC